MARILREAYEQDGVLNQAYVSLLIGVRAGTIGKDIRKFQFEQGVVLPYRAETSQSEEAYDRCIKGFKKVLNLHGNGIPAENIALDMKISQRRVQLVER